MNRRAKLGPIVVASIIMLGGGQIAVAQVDWAYQDVCVEPGDPGRWDSANHQVADVVFDGTTYHLFAVGGQTLLSFNSPWSVGHWTSDNLDGPWIEDDNNPVLEPEPGAWDSYSIISVAVRYDGSTFQMWYGATDAYPGVISVGYAWSDNGSLWTKYADNPLPGLVPGASGEWDDSGMTPSTVLYDGSIYGMWYTAVKYNGSSGTWRLGYASSDDGITWDNEDDPVLVGTEPWEGNNVYHPEVVPSGDGFAMWYTALVWGQMVNIGYATSPDGLHWGKWPSNPVLTPTPPCMVADSFAVMIEGDKIHGWTNTCDNDIYHVTSPFDVVVFFDTFETGDTLMWSNVVP
jgi:hypothetical protein